MAKMYRYMFANELPTDHPNRINPNTLLPVEFFFVYDDSEQNARKQFVEQFTITEEVYDHESRSWVDKVLHGVKDDMKLLERRPW